MKTNVKKLLLFMVTFAPSSSVFSQEDEIYEFVNTSTWVWQETVGLDCKSNSMQKLDVFNYHGLTKENKKNKTWSSNTCWLKIPIEKNKDYTITFNVRNLNYPKYGGISLYDGEVHKEDVYWGLIFRASHKSGASSEYYRYYCEEKNQNSSGTYTSYYESNTGIWNKCSGLDQHSIRIEYDGDSNIEIYNETESIKPMISFTNVVGLNYIGIKVGNAAHIIISDFKMKRKTDFGVAMPEIIKARKQIEEEDYKEAIATLTRLLNSYKGTMVYYGRACAYFYDESYELSIDDCTKALSYPCDDELRRGLYHLRGYCKLLIGDDTGVSDMKQAGEEGLAFLKEHGLEDYKPGQNELRTINKGNNNHNNQKTKNIPVLTKSKK